MSDSSVWISLVGILILSVDNVDVPDRIEAILQEETGGWLLFERPVHIVETHDPKRVAAAIASTEVLTRERRYHAVGFVSYEAGAAFGLPVRPGGAGLPLVWFALFDSEPIRMAASEWRPTRGGRMFGGCQTGARSGYELTGVAPSVGRSAFGEAFARIKAHLANGDSYQVDYTFRMRGRFKGDVRAFFADLVAAQRGHRAVFLQVGSRAICSASPELFFARTGSRLVARPMKGTARRGRTLGEDLSFREQLRRSEKQQAENVMIVDMVRNDLGRIAEVGSVQVPELFSVERYPNVWQMTSLVTAQSSVPLDRIFAAMHPSASVTGAPKVRSMEILTALEEEPRGVYTGAIGHLAPGGDARFNVAIRTAVVDQRTDTLEFGIGSGIVWDSDVAAEYEECLLKASVLSRRPAGFDLLETLRWTPAEGFFLFARHLQRLRESAEYFGFVWRPEDIHRVLLEGVIGCEGPLRVRLLLSKDGEARAEAAPLEPTHEPLRVGIATEPVDGTDAFLFHKTTNRATYECARRAGCDDVILQNGQDQMTEATTANVVIDLDGCLMTPPVECGLLAGTFRAQLIESGEVREAVVTLGALRRARRVWLVNSVYKWRPAVLV